MVRRNQRQPGLERLGPGGRPGGGFHPNENFSDYFHSQSNEALALGAIDQYLHNGYGVTLGIYGPGGHAITCWGFNYNPDNPSDYLGTVDHRLRRQQERRQRPRPAHYYEVESVGGQWFLQDYYGSDAWYIGTVQALEARERHAGRARRGNEIRGAVWDDADGDGTRTRARRASPARPSILDANHNGVWDEADASRRLGQRGQEHPGLDDVTSTLNVAGSRAASPT